MPSSTWHNIETFVEIIREIEAGQFLGHWSWKR